MDASDPKQVKAAAKRAKIADRQRAVTVKNLMSTIAGRLYIHDKLTACHIFSSSFSLNGLQMAFNEGERNQGLLLLNDIMQECPEQYVQMMREANERNIDEHSGSKDANGGDSESDADDGDRGREDSPDPHGYYKGRKPTDATY